MAAASRASCGPSNLAVLCSIYCLWTLTIHVPRAGSVSFNLTFSKPQSPHLSQLINCTGDAYFSPNTLELTRNQYGQNSTYSVGRATNLTSGYEMVATVTYENVTRLLAVQLTINDTSYHVNTTVDLKRYLPERVAVGFSAATGADGSTSTGTGTACSIRRNTDNRRASASAVSLGVCGSRRASMAETQEKKKWVWGLYGRNAILDAVDERLRSGDELHDECMERVLVVGLWCAHPDQSERPSIAQAMHVLQSEDARLPALPPQMYKTASDLAVTGRAYGALSVESYSGGDSSTTTTTTTTTGDSNVSSGSSTTALLRDSKERA
ncbi:unnamed protein product [Miscanthus lutarioriparius]|uniref:Legume lectin domain-containing protein n=1 Tax=Miscanthus lutarioriparius TaxID=422564 RepID=A0A811RM08_9POAL|nr:unnamed protein product [Miscanthus lutarioriparius]